MIILKPNQNPKECRHKNIIITYKSRYTIPQGWEKLQEQDDIDLSDYCDEYCREESVFCEDCGTYLD